MMPLSLNDDVVFLDVVSLFCKSHLIVADQHIIYYSFISWPEGRAGRVRKS